MAQITCPHCTFLNRAGRKKCAMCLKFLAVRASATPTSQTAQSHSSTEPSQASLDRIGTRKRSRSEMDDEPLSSPAPEPKKSASARVTSSPPQDTAKLNTFFSTASGKPVQVAKTSLSTAARKFSDFEGAAQSRESGGASETETEQGGGSSGLVATLFSTAGGRPVNVQAANLERAQEKFELEDTEERVKPPRAEAPRAGRTSLAHAATPRSVPFAVSGGAPSTVSSLFSTASGSAVMISAAALATARAKFDEQHAESSEEGEKDEETSASNDEETDEDSDGPSATPASAPATAKLQSRPSAMSRAPPPPSVPVATGARRGFVPPQRIAPASSAVVPAVTQSMAPAAASTPQMVRQPAGTRLAPLFFRNDVFASQPLARVPAYSELPAGFHFTLGSCGAKMRESMGIPPGGGRIDENTSVDATHFRQLLLTLGASRTHCSPEWCGQALLSALFKAAALAHCTAPATTAQVFSPGAVAVCLCQKYNTEIVAGRRPVLRQMTEGDVPAMSLATVYVSEHCPERAAPHTNIVRLSDGYYHLKATLDLPLSNLLRQGALAVGQRLAICGSRCALPNPCSPWECLDRVVLSLNYNGVRPVSQTSALGVAHAEPLPLPVALVHPMGGLVPVLKGVVARVMPAFFVTTGAATAPGSSATGGGGGELGATKVVRNWHAQLQHVDLLMRTAHGAPRDTAAGGTAALPATSEDGPRVARVTSALIVDAAGNEALIQQWENCTEEASVCEPDAVSGPVEGSTISVYGLTPAKAFTAFAPFTSAKLFHASRQLRYTTVAKGGSSMRVISSCLNDTATPFTMGAAVDVVGLFVGSLETEQGTFVLLLQEQDCYVLLQVPVATARSKLSFALPSTAGVPMVVEHAVFVTREDGDAGSDCARIFAKEYTRVVQRSVQPLLSKALQQAAALAVVFVQKRHKYQTRKDAIFGNLQESVAAPGRARDGGLMRPADTEPFSGRGSLANSNGELLLPDGLNMVAASASKTSRVPYYLRTSSASSAAAAGAHLMGGAGSARVGSVGVVLPDPRAPLPRSSTDLHRASAPMPVSPSSHSLPVSALSAASYGNVVSLLLHWETPPGVGQATAPVNLLMPDSDDDGSLCPPTPPAPTSGHRTSAWSPVFTVTWRYDVGETCVHTALIRAPAVLEALLEPCVGLQKICNVTCAQNEVEYSLQRHALLRRWKKDSSANALWWTVLSNSMVTTAPVSDEPTSEARMAWQPVEWATVKSMLKQALEAAFFRFNAETTSDQLRSVHFITDDCPVAELV